MFLLRNRNTLEHFGELEKAVETLICWLVFPQQFTAVRYDFAENNAVDSQALSTCI